MTSARVVAVTKPLIEGIETADEFLAYTARVSNPTNQMNTETAPRLLAYCQRKRHWSVFEMAHMVVEVKTTRAIAHQVIRHGSFRFQEFSQRYAAVQEPFTYSGARVQDERNRQASHETDDLALRLWWHGVQESIADLVAHRYAEALQKGIAKEVARNILPEGMTPTTFYMAGNVRSWIHYCSGAPIHPKADEGELLGVRAEVGTQLEHREVAEACQVLLYEHFPSVRPA